MGKLFHSLVPQPRRPINCFKCNLHNFKFYIQNLTGSQCNEHKILLFRCLQNCIIFMQHNSFIYQAKQPTSLYLVVHCSAQATQKTDTSIYYPEYNCNDRMLCPFLDIWSLLVVMEQFVFGSGIYPPLNLSEYIYM